MRKMMDCSAVVNDRLRGYSSLEIAARVGCSKATVNRILRLYRAARAGDAEYIDGTTDAPRYKDWARQFLPPDKQTAARFPLETLEASDTANAPKSEDYGYQRVVPESVLRAAASRLYSLGRALIDLQGGQRLHKSYFCGVLDGMQLMTDSLELMMYKGGGDNGEEV